MKNKKIILALLIVAFSLMLMSCTAVGRFMNPIVDGIVTNANDAYNLNFATITIEDNAYTYDGTAFAPAITKVEIASQEVEQKNYLASYANNINAGTATLTVTAAGDTYIGSKSVTFTISPKLLSEVTGKITSSYTYTGKEITPEVKDLKSGSIELIKDDYDLTYGNNVNVGTDTATLTVTGKGNYTGSVYFNFSISPLSLDGATITLNRNTYKYTGQANKPTVSKVTVGSNDYYISSDNFSISYNNNIEIGDGIAMIDGINNCSGQAIANFVITDETIYEISFASIDNLHFDSIFDVPGKKIQKPITPTVLGKETYILNWYTSSSDFSLASRFFFDEMPNRNLTLYGRWEEEIDLSFFAYENATPDLSIDSFYELVNLFEYISFNQITSKDEQEFYTMNYAYTSLPDELSNAWKTIRYPTTTGYGNTYIENPNGRHNLKIYLAYAPECVFEPTIQAEEDQAVQYNSFNKIDIEPVRTEDYNDFYIEGLTESYQVASSNQLYYLLEYGLKPNPVASSAASKIYEEAKKVLRQIINDDMSDYNKSMAIYQWLIDNITYDYGVADIENDKWINHNSFYLEGVFFDHIAVCDGISKAYVVLCQMEGIACVRVTGYANEPAVGHAWNKVKIDGQWFVVDATWGNTSTNGNSNEFLSYQDFMISDETKESYNCQPSNYIYQGIAATGENKYYENNGFVYNEVYYDFIIESQTELDILIKYCASYESIENYTVNFLIVFDYGDNFNDELGWAINTVPDFGHTAAYIISKNDKENITLFFS
jgi:transglutaminase-like putative cysteine protease